MNKPNSFQRYCFIILYALSILGTDLFLTPHCLRQFARLVVMVAGDTASGCVTCNHHNRIRPPAALWCQFETDEADLYDVADAGREGLAGGLVVQEGAVSAACVLHVPGVVAIPQARMLTGDE